MAILRRAGGYALPNVAAYALPLLSFVVGIALWELSVRLFGVPRYLLPAPSDIAQVLTGGEIDYVRHTLVTLNTAVTGFAIGVSVGFVIALLITLSQALRQIMMPYVVGLEVLPKVAIAPILYILLGFSDTSRIILVVILTFFPIVINVSTGLTAVDRNHVFLLRSLGANKATVFYKVRLPNSLPYFFDGLRIAVGGALVGAIVAEFVSSNSGLGFLILNSQFTFNTVGAFGAFAILAVLGLLFYGAVVLVGRQVMPWHRGA